jgi:hypothetical protein
MIFKMNFSRLVIGSLILIAVLLQPGWACAAVPQTSDNLVTNGSFSKWNGNLPVGWNVTIGASNGAAQPVSNVNKGEGPSLELSGNANTLAWNFVSQSVAAQPDETYRLTCEAKATGVKREGRQYDNCYVGVWFKNRAGKNLGNQFVVIGSEDYQQTSLVFRTPPQTALVDLAIFLSKTGKLNVKDVRLDRFASSDSFDLLVDEMKNHYSFFELKQIDFPKLVEKYRDKATAARSTDDFADVVADMLAELKDVHAWVVNKGQRVSKYVSSFEPNYHFQTVDADLMNIRRFGSLGLVGNTRQGFGYIRVSTLVGIAPQTLKQFTDAMENVFDAPGIILDLRRNAGGDEPTAKAIASKFANKAYTYARQKVRSGTGFTETPPRTIGPGEGKIYEGPVVCLIGPGAVSSAEGFALMMKAMDRCITVGKPTRGASGNPQPVQLPNGLDAYFSRWISLDPEGTPIEDVGVQPEIVVEHVIGAAADPAYQKAKEILAEKSGK